MIAVVLVVALMLHGAALGAAAGMVVMFWKVRKKNLIFFTQSWRNEVLHSLLD